MGRVQIEVLVWILALRISPCLSGKVSITLPMTQELRGVESMTKTMSPTLRLREMVHHLERFCSKGRYSFVHLFQNMSARY